MVNPPLFTAFFLHSRWLVGFLNHQQLECGLKGFDILIPQKIRNGHLFTHRNGEKFQRKWMYRLDVFQPGWFPTKKLTIFVSLKKMAGYYSPFNEGLMYHQWCMKMITIHQLECIASLWGENFLWWWFSVCRKKTVALDSWCRKSGEAVEYNAYTYMYYWANYSDLSQGTQMVGFARESPQNPLNSGLGITVICPDVYTYIYILHMFTTMTPTSWVVRWFLHSKIAYKTCQRKGTCNK